MFTRELQGARFRGETELLESIRGDDRIQQQLQQREVLKQRSRIRAQLLAGAVRVNLRLLPNLAESFERLGQQLQGQRRLEAFVFADAEVNGFVTAGSKRTIVAISSGAVSLLTSAELDFVIGHEIGHALYGHVDVPADHVIAADVLTPAQALKLRAWQRASEISADRAGLCLCNSLEVAASALFKTISGLNLPGLRVDPEEFARQWEQLVQEVIDQGVRDQCQLSHPFPPLRIKALTLFWNSRSQEAVEAEVAKLLSVMDPTHGAGAEIGDPLLARFIFWGGLFVSLAQGSPDPRELKRLEELAPPDVDLQTLMASAGDLAELAILRFEEARTGRQTKLRASEIHRIIQRLIQVATADGELSAADRDHLHRIGKVLGIRPDAVDLLIEKQNG
jgi:tellurite resistance protein